MTNRERQILELLKTNALIQQQEIAESLGISRSAVAGHIMSLVNKGYIQGRGYILAEHHYNRVTRKAADIDISDSAHTTEMYPSLTQDN